MSNNINPRKEDFERLNWQDAIADADPKTCQIYSGRFRVRADELRAQGDELGESAFRRLEFWTSARLQTDNPARPFPEAYLAAISETDTGLLRELVPLAQDAELHARLADLAWLGKINNKRDPSMARHAVSAYLTASVTFDSQEEWYNCAPRIERALQVAYSLGKNAPEIEQVWKHIEDVLAQLNGEDEWFLSETLMRLWQEYGRGDAAACEALYAPMAERAALKAEAQRGVGQWGKARRYWEVKAAWHPDASEGRITALARAAEAYVSNADEELDVYSNPIGAAMHLQYAVQAYRQIQPNDRYVSRIEELHRRMIEVNIQARDSLETFSHTIDTARFAEQAAAVVAGKSFVAGLREIVRMFAPPSRDTLRRQVPLYTDPLMEELANFQQINSEGQVVANRPSLLSPDPEKREEATIAEMYHLTGTYHALFVQGFLVPALAQMSQEHRVSTRDWLPLLRNSPFVPPGRELLFARGLQAGWEGDWIVSTHLLVPQVENSLRHILSQNGFLASALHTSGTQSEQGMDVTLKKPELARLLREDDIFDLRALLIEHTGTYFRHKTCHGLASYEEFLSVPSLYLWWTVLRMCLLPVITAQSRVQQAANQSQADEQSTQTAPIASPSAGVGTEAEGAPQNNAPLDG